MTSGESKEFEEESQKSRKMGLKREIERNRKRKRGKKSTINPKKDIWL